MDKEGRSSGLPSVIWYNRYMEPDDPVAYLYDFFTVKQLREIAAHNTVTHKANITKLNLARSIITQTDGKYLIPDDLTPATYVPDSKVQALRGAKKKEHLVKKAKVIDQQWKNTLSEEEYENSEKVKRLKRDDDFTVDPTEKVAVYSERNMSWDSVGNLKKGYNFITREEAEMWTRLRGVRAAAPTEVALHFDL